MTNRKILRILAYSLIGLVILTGSFQLYQTSRVTQNQQTALQLEQLLDLSDELSSNLGSVQQLFRTHSNTPSQAALTELNSFRGNVLNAVDSLKKGSAAFPALSSYAVQIFDTYHVQDKIIHAYTSSNLKTVNLAESNKAIAASEAGMSTVWTLLYEYRNTIKDQIQKISYQITALSAKSKNLNVLSLCILGILIVVILSGYLIENKSKVQFDTTKQMLSDDALLMKSLLDHTTTSMYIIDLQGIILFANKSFLEFFGLDAGQVLGKSFSQLELLNEYSYENAEIRMDAGYPYFEMEEEIIVNGNKLHFYTRKFPVTNGEEEVYASAIISRNITERILNEEGLKKSRQEAENAKLTQEQFMANISHEIRTPMNGILGMTDLLAATPLDPEQLEYVQTIRQSSDNLMILINDILDFSKIEAGKLELERISFKISDVVTQVVTLMKTKALEKQLPINLEIDYKVPNAVLGDPLRLYQILSNLLSNAIKFTSSGCVDIHISAKNYSSPYIKVVFKISDTGIGIPSERVDYIFQSFTQTSLDITRKFGGTGLGLAIVKQLVDLHNGTIAVESAEGKGSIFTVEIPFIAAHNENRNLLESSKFKLLKGKTVLVVEDNLINQKVIIKTLENSGLITTLCDNGFSALEVLRKQSFDWIIMDIQMPEIDGRETTRRIRTELKLEVPIIAMTASVLADERDKCKEAGMNEYISKPFVKEDLFEKMLLFV